MGRVVMVVVVEERGEEGPLSAVLSLMVVVVREACWQ
jgi:hypothetical protein